MIIHKCIISLEETEVFSKEGVPFYDNETRKVYEDWVSLINENKMDIMITQPHHDESIDIVMRRVHPYDTPIIKGLKLDLFKLLDGASQINIYDYARDQFTKIYSVYKLYVSLFIDKENNPKIEQRDEYLAECTLYLNSIRYENLDEYNMTLQDIGEMDDYTRIFGGALEKIKDITQARNQTGWIQSQIKFLEYWYDHLRQLMLMSIIPSSSDDEEIKEEEEEEISTSDSEERTWFEL